MTNVASGTLTADGTLQAMSDQTAAATYVLLVDLTNMQAGDITALSIYVKVLTGSTLHSCYYQQFFDAQLVGSQVAVSVPIPSLFEARFNLQQTAGTNRTYPWQLVSL